MKTYTLEEIKDNFFKTKTTKEILEDVKKIDLEETLWTFHDELRARDVIIQLTNHLEKAIEALKEVKKQHAPDTLANMIKRKPQCYDLAEQALKELGVE